MFFAFIIAGDYYYYLQAVYVVINSLLNMHLDVPLGFTNNLL